MLLCRVMYAYVGSIHDINSYISICYRENVGMYGVFQLFDENIRYSFCIDGYIEEFPW
jgi:hypothetical protein